MKFHRSDNILITGAAGLLGGAIKRQLENTSSATVLAPGRSEMDLLDFERVREYFERERPTHVFHAAAKVFGLGGNIKFPGDMYYCNSTMNSHVIEAAKTVGVIKLTCIGTGAVYPVSLDGQYLEERQIWDGPPHGAEWAYAQAKRGMLAQLSAYEQQWDLPYCYAVCGNLFGPNDLFDIENGHVIPSLVAKFHRALSSSTSVSIWGTGIAVRDFSYVDDAANAIISSHLKLTGPVNIASGHIHTIREIVEVLDELTGRRLEIVWDSTKPDGQGRRFYNLSKLESIGFVPKENLASGLKKTWDWYNRSFPDIRS